MLLALFGVVENWLYILIFNLDEKMQRLKIIELSDGGAAEIAGLMVGDWLDEYNGVSLSSSEALSAAMRKVKRYAYNEGCAWLAKIRYFYSSRTLGYFS